MTAVQVIEWSLAITMAAVSVSVVVVVVAVVAVAVTEARSAWLRRKQG